MALSGTIYGGWHSNGQYRIKLVWSATQNISANTSTITVKTYLDADWSVSYSATKSGSTTVDGQTQTWSSTDNHSGTGEWLVGTKTFTVSHNSDGTKSLSMSGWFDLNISTGNGYVGRLSASGSITLNTIPRASSVSISNFTIGNNPSVTVSRASSSFTHKFSMYVGSTFIGQWYWDNPTSDTTPVISLNSTHQDRIYQTIPNSTSTTVTINCYTYSGSTHIGTKSDTCTAYVGSSIIPTFSSISDSEYETSVLNHIGSYVQGKSRVNISINSPSGIKYSTIQSYKIEFDGKVYNSRTVTSDYVKGSGNLTIKATITDSRGRTYSKTKTITVLAYSPPAITTLKVSRSGTNADVNRAGEFSNLGDKNLADIIIKTKPRGASTWNISHQVLDDRGGTFGANYTLSGFEEDISYDVRVEVTDLWHTTISYTTLPTAKVPMSWGKEGIGVGKIYEELAPLEVGGDALINGKYISNGSADYGTTITVGGDANTYYPVGIRVDSGISIAQTKIDIVRGYNWNAPDTWNNSTHKGGLVLSLLWTGETSWSGNPYDYRVIYFKEHYSTMVSGIKRTTDEFLIVYLRGGGADYHISTPEIWGNHSVQVFLDGYTDRAGNQYMPRFNTGAVPYEIDLMYVGTEVGLIYPSLLNGWINYGVNYENAHYYKFGGIVHLGGLIKSGALNSYAFLLPQRHRPREKFIFNQRASGGTSRVDVLPDGGVYVKSDDNQWISLSGISFPIFN